MKLFHWIILGLVIFPGHLVHIPDQGDRSPEWTLTIDLNWKFILDDPAGASEPGYDDSDWRYLSLPHDWMIEQKVNRENPSGTAGGFYPGGIGWYRKALDLSEYENAEQFYLLFEGVMRNADVYFNGTHLGKQELWLFQLLFMTSASWSGMDTLNVIAVRTDCSKLPVDRWYSGGGIYRHVRLITTSSTSYADLGRGCKLCKRQQRQCQAGHIALKLKNNGRKEQSF